jgi:hypothetical protein
MIMPFLSVSVGKYRINPQSNPNFEKVASKPLAAMMAVANPTSLGL